MLEVGVQEGVGLLGWLVLSYAALVCLLLGWAAHIGYVRRKAVWGSVRRSLRYWVLGFNSD